MALCTCEFHCGGTYRHCPSAPSFENGYFQWEGDYFQQAVVDDIKIELGIHEYLGFSQPGDEAGTEDLVIILGIEKIRRMRLILEEAELIITSREKEVS
ncbi:hypothetical protein Hena1_00130 [Erwinia phage Hena1]|uniref:Uncharacterized protein n=1 Tax=Erwinia phage Hena1 TaxID=2678601 RepID=A0A6B9J9N0_9CAUD|nr:hypothetical protein HWC84_gp012 [Erwinia phage Hena1]QGZ16189.1 hypothetical protein Hena1_00130 [Erwinia phage Hena1]